MMSRFMANYEGVHFVAGVGLCELARGIQEHPTLKDKAATFLGLCEAMVLLTKEELWGMGGFAVTLQPKQVLEIPAGFAAWWKSEYSIVLIPFKFMELLCLITFDETGFTIQ